MKKINKFLCLALFLSVAFFITACQEQELTITFKNTDIVIVEGEEITLEPEGTYETIKYVVADSQIISIDGNTIKALKMGETEVKVLLNDKEEEYALIKVKVIRETTLSFDKVEYNLFVGQKITLSPTITMPQSEEDEVAYEISDSDKEVLSIENNDVTALKEGTVKVKATINGYDGFCELTFVIANRPLISFEKENYTLSISEEVVLSWEVLNTDSSEEVSFEISNDSIISLDDKTVTGLAEGTATITVSFKDAVDVVLNFTVLPLDTEKPELTGVENLTINYKDQFDPLSGIAASDVRDGDITNKITVEGNVKTLVPGVYTLTYKVVDAAGNEATATREVTVKWNSSVKFIGHAGCYLGIMNSEEAFINAATKKGYTYIECDVKQTSDGVFVVCHDNEFNGISLQSTTYEAIKDVEYTLTRGGVKYTTKICTLERYLEICKEYGCVAVVELKSSAGITNTDQSRMDELMEVIKNAGMLDQVTFLGSQYKCLQWVRDNGYSDIPCQYLVTSIQSESTLKMCIEYDFDISFNITGNNTEEWIKRYQAYGLEVSCWTFSQYQTAGDLQPWINRGVDYVTCDVLTGNDVTLPPLEDTSLKHTVTYKDNDGEELLVVKVKDGDSAPLPLTPEKLGYSFLSWDKDVSNITSDLEVTAQYEKDVYEITYNTDAYIYRNCLGDKRSFR